MSVPPIAPVEGIATAVAPGATGSTGRADFSDWLMNQVNATDAKLKVAESEVQQLALGEADSLHQVMISLSKAKTAFELTVQVRNRLLEGFQQVMRMNI